MKEVAIDSLEPGTTLVVHTRNTCYRFVVLHDPEYLLVQGSTLFPTATAVRFEGATDGAGAQKPGWVIVGLAVRMWAGRKRVTSSPVRFFSIETMPVMSMPDHGSSTECIFQDRHRASVWLRDHSAYVPANA